MTFLDRVKKQRVPLRNCFIKNAFWAKKQAYLFVIALYLFVLALYLFEMLLWGHGDCRFSCVPVQS